MAMIKCKECDKEISDSALTCPNCGAKTDKAKSKTTITTTIVIVVFLVGFFIYQLNFGDAFKTTRELKQATKELEETLQKQKEFMNNIDKK